MHDRQQSRQGPGRRPREPIIVGIVTVQNTIIALNQDPTGPDPDVAGPFVSLGHNLIGDGTGSSGFTAPGDQVGSSAAPIDPLLGPASEQRRSHADDGAAAGQPRH